MKNYTFKQKSILEFNNAVSNNTSIESTLKALNLTSSKTNRENIKTAVLKLGIDVSHWKWQATCKVYQKNTIKTNIKKK